MSQNILTINLSPRKLGTSKVMLAKCTDYLTSRGHSVRHVDLYSHLNNIQAICNLVGEADTLILAGPCYTNTYPADTIRLLEELEAHSDNLHGQKLYGIIQGGMPYAHTHISGLNMLKIFAKKVGLSYQGGFIMGLGAMLDGQPLSKLPNGKKVERQLNVFCEHIHNGTVSPDSVYEGSLLKMPGFIAWLLAKAMNKKTDRSFAKRGMDTHGPSPYLSDELQ